jgi:NAD(P)-dependent dehydrogenase (short-subunit alcohol dehydrogenase family)
LPAIGLAAPGLFGDGLVVVTPDDRGVAEAVSDRLTALDVAVEVRPDVPSHTRAVLYLGGLRAIRSVEDAIAVNREAFALAVRFAPRARDEGGLFVTVQDTGGDLGLSGRAGGRAWLTGLAALAKTAAQEWPKACARAIDVETEGRNADALADAIVRELQEGGSLPEVGLSSRGERRTLECAAAPVHTSRTPDLPAGAVIVATGGARGITAECLLALAREMGTALKPRFLLLGRTALGEEPAHLRAVSGDAALKRAVLAAQQDPARMTPRDLARAVERITASREVRANLERFAAQGAQARYAAVDVRDSAAVDALLSGIRQEWGPIHVLVHGAGVLSDSLLEKRTDTTSFDAVFDTKVRGLAALLSATSEDPLSWIALFSSVAAREGNAGQADYAMANEVLNRVAAAEAGSRRGCRATAIGWGPWESGMVTPALAQHFASRGVGLIPIEAGARAFVMESRTSGDVEVLLGGTGLGPSRRTVKAQLHVAPRTFPQLRDHRVRGAVVLPIVAAIDAFARLCAPWRPLDGTPLVLGDVRVLRGVVMPDFASRPTVLDLTLQPDGRLELRDITGALRICGRLLDAEAPQPPVHVVGEKTIALAGPLYGEGRLFHGPAFQLIKGLVTLSAQEAFASVAGVQEAGWVTAPSPCDPAALDAGLQLALLAGLCGSEGEGGMGQTLPLAIERVVLHRSPTEGPIGCSLRTRARGATRAVYDIVFVDAQQAPLAQLLGVQMYVVPSAASTASP